MNSKFVTQKRKMKGYSVCLSDCRTQYKCDLTKA
jgi:hypothetical protein